MQLPIETPTFRLRAYRADDAEPLAAQRSDPTTALWQDYVSPFSLAQARARVEDQMRRPDVVAGQWWNAAIADPLTDGYIGRDRKSVV